MMDTINECVFKRGTKNVKIRGEIGERLEKSVVSNKCSGDLQRFVWQFIF